jgi:hypothetical protein
MIDIRDLTDDQINFIVAVHVLYIADVETFKKQYSEGKLHYTTDISIAWPIISAEKMYISDWPTPNWRTGYSYPKAHVDKKRSPSHHCFDDSNPLKAAMKTFISSVFGDVIDDYFLDDFPNQIQIQNNQKLINK